MIKVLVVDDSALMVRLLSEIINNDPELSVVGTASHGYDAVKRVKHLIPDVITMDVNMPRMDGLKAVEHIMSIIPTPIVMISSLTREGAAITIQALELGAIDFVSKPSGYVSLDIEEVAGEIIAKIKLASKIRVIRTVTRPDSFDAPIRNKKDTQHPDTSFFYAQPQISKNTHNYNKVVIIGCSTGGPQALNEILKSLAADFPAPILVVQHMPEKFTEKLAELLNHRVALHVVEAKEGMVIQKGVVYIAPGAYHMQVRSNRSITLFRGELEASLPCPSVDILMQSAAEVYGRRVLGVILTGMGNDGVIGMNAIKDQHGATVAQDEETSLVFGMPKMAIEAGTVDSILPLPMIAQEMIELVKPKKRFSLTKKE